MDMLRRMVWFGIVTVFVCYAIFFVLGQFVNIEFGLQKPIAIRDDISPGVHLLSGIVTVSSPCDQLSLETHMVASGTYELVFGTWQEPAVTCTNETTAREFQTVVFAPLDVSFVATVDGSNYPTAVVQRIASSTQL
ncbi:MAG TPA: hypothetical protein VMU25_03010 [Candidatus Paceibacterota bacterium]|nr:hypothetical protein [Candidatus Paceibacterota bacterium]